MSGPARLDKLRACMAEKELPALLVSQMTNVGWLTGFSGSNGFALVTPYEAIFATDSRYTEQAKAECPGFEIVLLPTSAPEEITAVLQRANAPKIGFESDHLTFRMHEVYREKLPDAIELVATSKIVDDLRLTKDAEEIARIEAACAVADRTFEMALPLLRPGACERDVLLEMEWFVRKECRAEAAFDFIVASGPRSALPHGRASERVMQRGDLVTLDFGARLNGYNSDITRTVVLGPPTDEQRKVYEIVLEALRRGIEAIVVGADGKAVDAVARDYITDAGYGDYFGHGLGHSLGRAVHDGNGFSKRSELTVGPNMVFTAEPGIYIPGWGGIRIEDNIVTTTDGPPRLLTHSTRELLTL